MGHEAVCNVRFGKQRSQGKALLETSELIFRGDFRLKIPFSTIKSAKAVDGELRLHTAQGVAILKLGSAANKWCEKILHPKTRMDKLGVKPAAAISLIGDFGADFLAELQACTNTIVNGKVSADSEWIFFSAQSAKELAQIAKLAKNVQGSAALWIIYPKDQKTITESDVLTAGRKAGLKDVKVAAFSPTQTALKFVLPLDKR